MSDELPPHRTLDQAAFVYFDAAPTYGIMNGAIQVELASRVMRPDGPNVAVEFLITGHIRCSPIAASSLRDALDAALKMLDKPQAEPSAAAAKLN